MARWYEARGYAVLARNWRVREGELDLVVAGPTVVVFCEVKSRSGDTFGQPFEAVTAAKQARLRRLAMLWLQSAGRSWPTVRFDVGPEGTITEGSLSIDPPMPDAFDGCVRSAFSAARFGDVGGEGAGVELEMGRGRRGRGDASLDGGVPRSRDRSRDQPRERP